jgi:hypothetical protein
LQVVWISIIEVGMHFAARSIVDLNPPVYSVDLTSAQHPTDFSFHGLTPDQLEHLNALVLDDDFQGADTLRMQVRVACGALPPPKRRARSFRSHIQTGLDGRLYRSGWLTHEAIRCGGPYSR